MNNIGHCKIMGERKKSFHNFRFSSKHLNMSSTKKRKFLTLDERVAVIKQLESGKSSRKVAEQFGVGRTQIQVQYFAKGRVAGARGWVRGGEGGRGHSGNFRL